MCNENYSEHFVQLLNACTYRHTYCLNHLSYIYFDMSFSHVQFILCESRTHLPSSGLDAEISD